MVRPFETRFAGFSDHEVQLFSTSINAGRASFECEQVTVANVADTRERYVAAASGESVSIVLNCVGKCRFISSDQSSPTPPCPPEISYNVIN
jgi:hypothetical protein